MIWMLVALNTYQPIRTFTTEQECLFWRNSIMMQVSFRLADAKPPGLDSTALLGHRSDSAHQRYMRDKDVLRVE